MEHLKIQLSLSLPFPEWASADQFLSQRLYNQQTAFHIPALMWLSIIIPIMLSILVIVCVLLTLVVLMQRPKNEGLGAAFGSSMTENIFGAQTATVLTKATVYLGCIFFAVTLILTVLTARQSMDRRVGVLENEVRKAAVAATPKTIASPAASGSPQATASIAASATPVSSSSPAPSTTPFASASPSPSVATESSPASSPGAMTESSPAPSPSVRTETSPVPSPSVGQASPAPSPSP